MVRKDRWSLWAVVVLLAPLAVFAAPASFSERLSEADRIRSSDPQRLAVLLEELNATQRGVEPSLVQQLQFLKIYQMVVYRNQVDEGVAQAKVLFDEAIEHDLRFRAGTFLTNTLGTRRQFSEGLRVLNEIIPMRDQVENKEWRDVGLNSAAIFYNYLGQHELALHYANEVLEGSSSNEVRCVAGMIAVEAQHRLGTLPADDALIDKNIEQCLAIGNRMAANFDRMVLARQWSGRGETDRAITLLEKHAIEADAVGFHGLRAEFHALLAELKLKKSDLDAAEAHAQAAIAVTDLLQAPRALATANKVLFQVAERRGDAVAALAYFQSYAEADKAALNEVNTRELAYQTVHNEILQSNHKIQLLSQQNEVLQLQQRVQKQSNQNMGMVVVLLALLVAVIGYWAYKVKRLHLILRHFAETDALTGISNRRHFTQQGQHSLEQCQLGGESAALIMFDLDRFKAINDTYGHDAGDWVLERVATSCKGLCRRIDRFGRIGGEEFAILLHGCELNAAVRLAEDCRVRLSMIDTRECGHTFPMTASFGVTSTALSGYSLSALMSHADLMLYRAKREGRNMVRAYGNDLPAASTNSSPVVSLEAAREVLPVQEPTPIRKLERRSS
ncbi:MAG: GGDEF domain-containing protein [Lysobacter sp.]|nr:GGDEF domain-containing protein [Lysobacter sp.]